jgi:hypothetical protein
VGGMESVLVRSVAIRPFADLLTCISSRNVYCDNCRGSIAGSRNICTVCIDKEFSDTYDLCDACIDTCGSLDSFVHERSHAVVRVTTMLPSGTLAWMIPRARKVAQYVKEQFAPKEDQEPVEDVDSTSDSPRKCLIGECGSKASVEFPFWVCLECASESQVVSVLSKSAG